MTDKHKLSGFSTDRDVLLMAAWTLPNEGVLTNAQRKAALENFRDYCRRRDIKPAEVARQLKTPQQTTIGDLLKGVYRENADEHIRTLNNWVEQHARQAAVQLQGSFVHTRVAREILKAAEMIRENQTMGLVWGPSGIGKTRCAEAVSQKMVGSILIRARRGNIASKGFVTSLAQKLGVRKVAKSQSDGDHLTQLERVFARLDKSLRLLIVDEAQQLRDDTIELLRDIHDVTGIPIMLMATRDLHDRFQRNRDSDHGQLYSRVDIDIPLVQGHDADAGGKNKKLFTVEDIKALYEQPPIRLSKDATNYLVDLANKLGDGSLRRCRILLTNAARRARKRMDITSEADPVTVTAGDLEYAETRLRPDETELEMVRERIRRGTAAMEATG